MNSNADVTRRRSSRLSTTASAVKDSDSKDASAPRRHRLASSPIPEERPTKRPKKSQSVVKEATAGGAIASTSAVTKRKKRSSTNPMTFQLGLKVTGKLDLTSPAREVLKTR
ncbi:hypothetical protein QCA50_003705 [Cerrena zonata]|uniref:Uncharacterized protein n=1 Tax=Cerrena zonata TaxID=2478898 RepID=A0AAW0GSV9_9APHY